MKYAIYFLIISTFHLIGFVFSQQMDLFYNQWHQMQNKTDEALQSAVNQASALENENRVIDPDELEDTFDALLSDTMGLERAGTQWVPKEHSMLRGKITEVRHFIFDDNNAVFPLNYTDPVTGYVFTVQRPSVFTVVEIEIPSFVAFVEPKTLAISSMASVYLQ